MRVRRSFHISDIKKFTQCRTAWYFSSHMGQGKTVNETPSPIKKGIDVHKALETYYFDKGTHILDLCDTELTRDITSNYISWAEQNDDFEPIWMEQHFELPFFTDDEGVEHKFSGRWDLIVKRVGSDGKPKLWINDWKVTAQYFDSYATFLSNQDEQMKAYSWVGHQLFGDMFGGVMVTMIKSTPPQKPKILQSGKLSKDKSQKTSWSLYKSYLDMLGEDINQYSEVRDELEKNPYVQRIYLNFSKKVGERWHQRNVGIAKEMVRKDLQIYSSPSVMNCRGCWFKDPCSLYNDHSTGSALKLLSTAFVNSEYAKSAKDEEQLDGNK